MGLDFGEVVGDLAAGLDGGGEDAGFLGLADVVVGVTDAGPEDIVDRIGVAFGNLQLPGRPAYGGHDRLIGLHQRPAEICNNQVDASVIAQVVLVCLRLDNSRNRVSTSAKTVSRS